MLSLLVSLMLAPAALLPERSADLQPAASARIAWRGELARPSLAGSSAGDSIPRSHFGEQVQRRPHRVRALARTPPGSCRKRPERERKANDAGDKVFALRTGDAARLEMRGRSRGQRVGRKRRSTGSIEPRGPTAEERDPAGPPRRRNPRFELDRSAPSLLPPHGFPTWLG